MRLYKARDSLTAIKRHLELRHGEQDINVPKQEPWMKILHNRLEEMNWTHIIQGIWPSSSIVKVFNPTEFGEALHPDWIRHNRELVRNLWDREYKNPPSRG